MYVSVRVKTSESKVRSGTIKWKKAVDNKKRQRLCSVAEFFKEEERIHGISKRLKLGRKLLFLLFTAHYGAARAAKQLASTS